MTYPKINEIENSLEFTKEILQAVKIPAIVVFSAEWSGSGQMLVEVLVRAIDSVEQDLNFFYVDVDRNTEIVDLMRVKSVPTVLIFKEGEVVSYIQGMISGSKFKRKIEEVL